MWRKKKSFWTGSALHVHVCVCVPSGLCSKLILFEWREKERRVDGKGSARSIGSDSAKYQYHRFETKGRSEK